MGRPPAFDRQDALEKIMHRIWRDGYESASVKALSEMLGITRSSFYNAFDSREALLDEVLQLYFSKAPDYGLAEIGPETSIKVHLTGFFRRLCHARASDPETRGCLAVNCFTEMSPDDVDQNPFLKQVFRAKIERLKGIIETGKARGELTADMDPEIIALALNNLILGLNILSKVETSEAKLWAMVQATLQGLGLFGDGVPDTLS